MTVFKDAISFVAGDDLIFNLRITDDFGDPADARGDLVYITLKTDRSQPDEESVLQKSWVIDDSELSAKGVVRLTISSSESNITAGTYWYDYQWVKSQTGAGEVKTVQLGKVKVIQGVTRA